MTRTQKTAAKSARWQRILERVVREGIVVVGPDGRVEYVSEPARRLLSDDPAEVDRLVAVLRERVEERGVSSPVRVGIDTSRGPRNLFVETEAVQGNAGPGRIYVLKDASTVEVLEEDLFLANRMRGLGELYLSMAHDLKTPINAMTLTLDALRDSLVRGPDTEEEAARRLEEVGTVRNELTRFHRAIQTLLSQTSLSSITRRRRVDLRRILREVARITGPLAKGRDVTLRPDLGDVSLPIDGCRDRLRQAFQNVVANAIEASPSGREVCIVARPRGPWIVTEVLDEGPGLPSALGDRAFQMHVTTKPGGSGIGLFVTRAAVLSHGGEIDLRNRRERGAVVEIRLPKHAAATVTA